MHLVDCIFVLIYQRSHWRITFQMLSLATQLLGHPVVVSVVVVLVLTRLYCFLTDGVCTSTVRLDGKTVLITGAGRGIGKAVARDLAGRGARVILACVDLGEAEQAREQIVAETGNEDVVVRFVDLSVMSAVRRLAAEVTDHEHRLDVLIHNAGAHSGASGPTAEGLNPVWAINLFGPFLLTHLLIDLMKKTGKGRIIFTASIAHWFAFLFGSIDLKNPNPVEVTSSYPLYAMSKFATVLTCNELARRLEPVGIAANSLHPGHIDTVIFRTAPPLIQLYRIIMKCLLFKTVEQGAQTTIHLAVSEQVEGVTGKYFADCKVSLQGWGTNDREVAKKYWELCETIVGLKYSDPHI